MPIVQIQMLSGRSDDQKRRLIEEMTRVMNEVVGTPVDRIHVVINEFDAGNWGRGGVPMAELLAAPEGARVGGD